MKLILPPRLEHRPLHLVERRDLLEARLASDLLGSHPLLPEVFLDHLPVLDENQRLRLEQRTKAPKAKP